MLYGVDKLRDRTRLLKEGKELSAFLARQAFHQIPGMSAVAAVTAYAVSKILKVVREQQMQKNMIRVSQLGEEIQALVNDRLAILEKAKETGLLSAGEYLKKKANLYNEYARIPSLQIKDLLIGKLTS